MRSFRTSLGSVSILIVAMSFLLWSCWVGDPSSHAGDLCPDPNDSLGQLLSEENWSLDFGRCDTSYSCMKSEDDPHAYFCELGQLVQNCGADQVLCNKRCINPDSDIMHCGAKGSCTSSEEGGKNFWGVNCESIAMGMVCSQGKCHCPDDHIICDGQCINPANDRAFCGAKGNCSNDGGSNNVKGELCNENEDCIDSQCMVRRCNDGEELCPVLDHGQFTGQNACINPLQDKNHCGACLNDCKKIANIMNYALADPPCNEGKCQFKCPEKSVDCSESEQLLCLSKDDFKQNSLHCGGCNISCNPDQHCKWDEVKMTAECVDSECTNGDTCPENNCQNSPQQCGTRCTNCEFMSGMKAECVESGDGAEGVTSTYCSAIECPENMHLAPPELGERGNKCVANSDRACGARDDIDAENCLQDGVKQAICEDGKCIVLACDDTKYYKLRDGKCVISCCNGKNIAEEACVEGGLCKIIACKVGYHIERGSNDTGGQFLEDECVKNSATACGTVNNLPTNCVSAANHAVDAICTKDGECQITECRPDYHLTDGNECVENNVDQCGSVFGGTLQKCNHDTESHCRKGVCIGRRVINDKSYIYCNETNMKEEWYIGPIYCKESGNAFNLENLCGYSNNDVHNVQVNCNRSVSPLKCLWLVNGATCEDCGECTHEQTCYQKADKSWGCRDNLFPDT